LHETFLLFLGDAFVIQLEVESVAFFVELDSFLSVDLFVLEFELIVLEILFDLDFGRKVDRSL
jgi:hypothetical protein